jgi:hypothetical protein
MKATPAYFRDRHGDDIDGAGDFTEGQRVQAFRGDTRDEGLRIAEALIGQMPGR